MSYLWRGLSWFLSALLVVSCALVLVVVGFTVAQRIYGYESYTVLSGSMRPTIPVGSLVITHAIPAHQVRVGDIITFHPPAAASVLVTHRVHAIEPSRNPGGMAMFVTKGDANRSPDLWRVPVTGTPQRCVAHLPWAGYISTNLQTPIARVLFLFLPGVLLCLLLLVETWRPSRQQPAAAGPQALSSR